MIDECCVPMYHVCHVVSVMSDYMYVIMSVMMLYALAFVVV